MKLKLYKLLITFAIFPYSLGYAKASLSKRIIYAAPRGGNVFFDGRQTAVEEVITAIKKARPGDEVILLPGNYKKNLSIQKQGSMDAPIVIKGIPGMTTFACNDLPTSEGKPAISISVSDGLVLKDLKFENCWPFAIEIVDSAHISLTNNDASGGNNFTLVRERSSHHIVLENNKWNPATQTKALETSQTKTDKSDQNYFVKAVQIAGDLLIKDNELSGNSDILHLEGLRAPYPPSSNIKVIANNTTGSSTSALNLSGDINYLWLSENHLQSVGGLVRAKDARLSSAFVLNNTLVASATNHFEDSVPLFEINKDVELIVAHNQLKCTAKIFADLPDSGAIYVLQNSIETCADTPLLSAKVGKALRVFDFQAYQGTNILSKQQGLGVDKHSQFSSPTRARDIRQIHPSFSRIAVHSEQRMTGLFSASTATIGPWPLLPESDFATIPSPVHSYQSGHELHILLDRALVRGVRGIMIDNNPSDISGKSRSFCNLQTPGEIRCGLASNLESKPKLGFEVYGPEDSVAITDTKFETSYQKSLKPQQMPRADLKVFKFKQ